MVISHFVLKSIVVSSVPSLLPAAKFARMVVSTKICWKADKC